MLKLLRYAFYYLFYFIYRFIENWSFPRFWSEWKTSAFMNMTVAVIYGCIFLYCELFFKSSMLKTIMDNALLPVGIGVCILSGYLDFMLFHNKNQWRQIVKKYDKLSKKEKTIRSILVIFL